MQEHTTPITPQNSQNNTTNNTPNAHTKRPQFSEKDLKCLDEIYPLEKSKTVTDERALFLVLCDKIKSGLQLDKKDKSFVQNYIKLYRYEQKSKEQAKKLNARLQADNQEKRAKIEHIKFVLGGLVMSDTSLFENPKMPYFLDLLLVAFGITNNEKVSKGNREQKPSFWVQDGNIFYQIACVDAKWCYRILEKVQGEHLLHYKYQFDKKLSGRLDKYAK